MRRTARLGSMMMEPWVRRTMRTASKSKTITTTIASTSTPKPTHHHGRQGELGDEPGKL